MNLSDLETIIFVKFDDIARLNQALIHRSYLNENKKTNIQSNERYEFLGDAVLELWATDTLFRLFPDFDEGKLTNLRALIVCTPNLAQISTSIKLSDFLLLSNGEEKHGGRDNQSILADTLESLIGAIYLDQGLTIAYAFLDRFFRPSLDLLSQKEIYKDPKSIFQEIAQRQAGITPHYQTVEESGPDHSKNFKMAVYLDKRLIATGTGLSKQKAEESAAIAAAKKLSKKSLK